MGHFVRLMVFFYCFAEGALAGCHEEDGCYKGFLIGVGCLWVRQGRCQFVDKGCFVVLVSAECGAEEQEGLEMGLLGDVVELQVVENAVGVQSFLVLTMGLLCLTSEDASPQDVEQLFLHALDEIGFEHLVYLSSGDVHIGVGTLIECQHELVVEHRDGQGELVTVLCLGDFLNRGLVILEESFLDVDGTLLERVFSEGSEGESLAVFHDQGDERRHLLLGQSDGDTIACSQIMKMEASTAVPLTIEEFVDLMSGGLDEDEVVEEIAQGIVFCHFIWGFPISLLFPF